MSARATARLAWSSFGVTMALLVTMTLLSAGREPLFDTVLYGLLLLYLTTVGALIASRHPQNAIGWMFCGLAIYGSLTEIAEGWGYFAAELGLPGGGLGEWIILWGWIVDLMVWIMIFLLFPNGRLPSRRWRFVPWISAAGCVLMFPGQALSPSHGSEFTSGVNPFAVEGIPTDLLFNAGVTLLMIALLAAIFSLFVRFRRAGNVERQQLKWFALAAGFLVATIPFAAAFYYESILVRVVVAIAINTLPVAVGIAILKHRLYDIDLVINRALVYGALTVMLIGTYLGSVLSLQYAFRAFTGSNSQLVIVASTLVIAALFNPLRRRIQTFVDRRFYRRKYDAAKVLQAFSATLRDETDLDSLGDELVAVTRETMQPTRVSLWFRTPKHGGTAE